MLLFILTAATLVAVYWFWIRPILKSRPAFRTLYQQEETFIGAIREKFAGLKQKLSSAIVIAASAIVSGYDFFVPIVSGVDVSSIAAQVPSWAWPLILIAVTAVMKYFRDLADRRHAIELGNESPAPQEK
ncbi:MAG: hypothetical protein KGK33_08815 [Hyphomicrobiales bacterium]|nr:hypothetical protein [Hyphomicrobiales bacterium]